MWAVYRTWFHMLYDENIPFKYQLFSKKSIRPINGTLSGTTTLAENGPGSNSYETVTPLSRKRSRTGTFPVDEYFKTYFVFLSTQILFFFMACFVLKSIWNIIGDD